MAETGRTLALDPDRWDLTLDAQGRIRTISGDEAIAQNVACAVRAFTDDMYLNRTDGVCPTSRPTSVTDPVLVLYAVD